MSLLTVTRVSKSFGSLRVIDDLSVSLAPGEALGIIGPNGAGKSTLFNLITGDLRPDSGAVAFDGAEITSTPVHRRCRAGIARSYQIPHPFTKMSVFENVLVAAVYGGGEREAAARARSVDVLEQTGLLARANDRAGALTLLERKRLEMARALATRPRVLLLDEIGGGLSEYECQALIDTIRAIHAGGVSLIWIEHIVHALVSMVERLVVIEAGRVLEEGAPREVMARPSVEAVYLGAGVE